MPNFFLGIKLFCLLSVWAEILWGFMISAHSDNNKKNFVPKKNMHHVTIRDFKKQKIWFSK